ncbi:hypothetical protein PPH93_25800 [Achromobacter xylosoxidans]|uniref:hypothetical protein n=1 Tax=Alcaligenes xylosoxydans xylosoxydans TaxID=85698 RepID=UPI0012A981ED|nr:hypothetical protein [Achromobacter xylosoxidans]MDC6165084.1 hypothetical protein [Achromobacter xylosoxidans]CUR67703.1 hypothetical protein BN2877_31280 [Achromobacter xylosoxidans]CUR74144.1 hypothetical protein BN2905_32790 [Achromobacter xylosoxidans]
MSLALDLLDFSRELGLPDCRLNDNGEWLAALANQQYLGVQEREGAVLVFILHPLGYDGLDVFERACRQAHLFHLREDTVQLALRERDHQRWLVALSRIPRSEFSGPRGARACSDLRQWLQTL